MSTFEWPFYCISSLYNVDKSYKKALVTFRMIALPKLSVKTPFNANQEHMVACSGKIIYYLKVQLKVGHEVTYMYYQSFFVGD